VSRRDAFWPDRDCCREWFRPWKLVIFALSMEALLYGALFYSIPDWDVGVTLLMGVPTYLCAPWCVNTLQSAVRYQPPGWWWKIPVALGLAYVIVDPVYWVYHSLAGNPTFREENFKVSYPLFFLAGFAWWYCGSLRELWAELRWVFRLSD